MRILGIETSCDETAIAVIEVSGPETRAGIRILSNIISSQVKLHAKFGGVVPNLAKREHQRNLVPVLLQALRRSRLLESRSMKHESREQSRRKINDSRFMILNSILEREPELFARISPKVTALLAPYIDAVAVTVGPGLAPALWVGVNFARSLAFLWKKPIIPVNHLEGHILANLIPQVRENPKPEIRNPKQISNSKIQILKSKASPNAYPLTPIAFPALCLIVSGGHTELVLMSDYGKYRVIGETLDDAAGEAFDKVAKMMGLGFPGGPAIAAEAAKFKIHPASSGTKFKISLPRPMMNSRDYNFSFSGLKTAVLYLLKDLTLKYSLASIRPLVAREFQNAVTDVLISKTVRAARQHRAKTVMIGGGVAANKQLRARLGKALRRALPDTCYLLPDVSLTGDNALMIALAGWFNRQKKKTARWASIGAEANLRLG